MSLSRAKLSDSEVQSALTQLQGWAVKDDKLSKEFSFRSYANGVLFATTVAHLADKMDHHPDIVIGYQRVGISVNTHDANGLSLWDFELARKIESV